MKKQKTLVVQKTGWGKSVVYFVATKILRENGHGPTLIISPLLALMDNQVDAAKKLKLDAITIHSDNKDQWNLLHSRINMVDAIIVSAERLGNAEFNSRVDFNKFGMLLLMRRIILCLC